VFKFDPQSYGPVFSQLIDTSRPDDLGPGKPNAGARDRLKALRIDLAFAERKVVDYDAAQCCLAGVWLLHNYFDESHSISQEIETTDGSYWHGILHRREPDYGNAKYWFRRVGDHPVFTDMAAGARRIATTEATADSHASFLATDGLWDPYRFIDLVEKVARGKSQAGELCLQAQRLEWQLLFDHCYRKAVG